jgi:translation initiation factor RLI1
VLYYGTPENIAKAIKDEIELLTHLLNKDEKLDVFIKKKIELLNKCLAQVGRLSPGEYQLVAINTCELIPLI